MEAQDRVRKIIRWHTIGLGIIVLATMAILLSSSKIFHRGPTDPHPLAQGRQVYTVSTGGTGPKITQVAIEPFDPKLHERQRFTVNAHYSAPISALMVEMHTDQASSTYSLALQEGTDQDGVWSGDWEVADTHRINYLATVRAVSGTSTSVIDLTLR